MLKMLNTYYITTHWNIEYKWQCLGLVDKLTLVNLWDQIALVMRDRYMLFSSGVNESKRRIKKCFLDPLWTIAASFRVSLCWTSWVIGQTREIRQMFSVFTVWHSLTPSHLSLSRIVSKFKAFGSCLKLIFQWLPLIIQPVSQSLIFVLPFCSCFPVPSVCFCWYT